MNIKKILLISIPVLLVIVVIAAVMTSKKPAQQTVTPTPIDEMSPSSTTKKYTDAAGFSFSYPDDITIEKQESDDETVYAELELTSDSADGNSKIEAVETEMETVADWRKENAPKAEAKKTKLAKIDAESFAEENILYTVAIDQGVVFIITSEYTAASKDYWTAVHEKIVSSFAFELPEEPQAAPADDSTQAAPAAESEIEFEGEEVIE